MTVEKISAITITVRVSHDAQLDRHRVEQAMAAAAAHSTMREALEEALFSAVGESAEIREIGVLLLEDEPAR